MSWIVEAPNNNPSVFVLISSTVFQIDGVACVDGSLRRPLAGAAGGRRALKAVTGDAAAWSRCPRLWRCRVGIFTSHDCCAGGRLGDRAGRSVGRSYVLIGVGWRGAVWTVRQARGLTERCADRRLWSRRRVVRRHRWDWRGARSVVAYQLAAAASAAIRGRAGDARHGVDRRGLDPGGSCSSCSSCGQAGRRCPAR